VGGGCVFDRRSVGARCPGRMLGGVTLALCGTMLLRWQRDSSIVLVEGLLPSPRFRSSDREIKVRPREPGQL
jgi:hypothetical protein